VAKEKLNLFQFATGRMAKGGRKCAADRGRHMEAKNLKEKQMTCALTSIYRYNS
jgi:hypothetical protein